MMASPLRTSILDGLVQRWDRQGAAAGSPAPAEPALLLRALEREVAAELGAGAAGLAPLLDLARAEVDALYPAEGAAAPKDADEEAAHLGELLRLLDVLEDALLAMALGGAGLPPAGGAP